MKTVKLLIISVLAAVSSFSTLKADIWDDFKDKAYNNGLELGIYGAIFGTSSINSSSYKSLRGDARAMGTYKIGNFSVTTHYLVSSTYSEDSLLRVPLMPGIKSDKYSLLRLSHISSNKNSLLAQSLDRLVLDYTSVNSHFYVGRTAITWSRARAFHVVDFFSPQIPGIYDGSYKQGADIAGFSYNILPNHTIEVNVSPKRDKRNYNITAKDSTFAARYIFTDGVNDYSLFGAQYLRDVGMGAGLSMNFLWGTVLRVDSSLWQDNTTHKYYSMNVAALERSYLLFNRVWTLFSEFYYNGAGYNDKRYIGASLTPIMQRRVLEQATYITGKYYGSLGISAELSDNISGNLTTIMNLYDRSNLSYLTLSYNFTNRVSFAIVGSIGLGGKGDEFGKICDINSNNCSKSVSLLMGSVNVQL